MNAVKVDVVARPDDFMLGPPHIVDGLRVGSLQDTIAGKYNAVASGARQALMRKQRSADTRAADSFSRGSTSGSACTSCAMRRGRLVAWVAVLGAAAYVAAGDDTAEVGAASLGGGEFGVRSERLLQLVGQ